MPQKVGRAAKALVAGVRLLWKVVSGSCFALVMWSICEGFSPSLGILPCHVNLQELIFYFKGRPITAFQRAAQRRRTRGSTKPGGSYRRGSAEPSPHSGEKERSGPVVAGRAEGMAYPAIHRRSNFKGRGGQGKCTQQTCLQGAYSAPAAPSSDEG